MRARIAVVHARGAPLAAARAIAGVFERLEVAVEVHTARAVTSVSQVDAVVVLGMLGPGGWRDDAVAFIGRFRRPLAYRTLAYAVGLPAHLDPARTPAQVARGLAHVLDWYNELRPVKVGLFHFESAHALGEVRAWSEHLAPNFVGPHGEAPGGLRPFLEARPAECGDPSARPNMVWPAPV